MAYDTSRGVSVVFGGSPDHRSDTWEWDGASWAERRVAGPPARYLHAMAFDSNRQEVRLFGGRVVGAYTNDLWAWDGEAWREVPTPGLRPPARFRHAMVYDTQRRRLVVFGGRDDNLIYGDTWEYGLYPDCDQSTGAGSLDIFDFLCFQNRYATSDPYACDCDTATGPGLCDIFDFLCFQNLFANCGE